MNTLIQHMTPALLESQSILPDRELNTLYRYVAFIRNSQQSPYVLMFHHSFGKSGWSFISEYGTSIGDIKSPCSSIKAAIIVAQSCGFEVYRISNSSL